MLIIAFSKWDIANEVAISHLMKDLISEACYLIRRGHLPVWSLWLKKGGCSCISTTVCLHNLNSKRLKKKKLDGNYIRILHTVLNESWKQHPTKQQLYGHLAPISQTIQIRRERHTEHCYENKDEFTNDVLLWVRMHEYRSIGLTAKTYLPSQLGL